MICSDLFFDAFSFSNSAPVALRRSNDFFVYPRNHCNSIKCSYCWYGNFCEVWSIFRFFFHIRSLLASESRRNKQFTSISLFALTGYISQSFDSGAGILSLANFSQGSNNILLNVSSPTWLNVCVNLTIQAWPTPSIPSIGLKAYQLATGLPGFDIGVNDSLTCPASATSCFSSSSSSWSESVCKFEYAVQDSNPLNPRFCNSSHLDLIFFIFVR
jgi:hypothetical protein